MARPPRALDLFSCAGGAGYGYDLAGFQVTGVDIQPQPNYPFDFIQADALEYLADHGAEFDFIHASPPCQAYSPLNAYNHKTYPDLISPVRPLLQATGRPFVIENVEAARGELQDPIMLCGPMFQLRMYRHRLFEAGGGLVLPQLEHPEHTALCARNGYLPTPERSFMTITGGKHSRAWLEAAKEAMGMSWVQTIREVCEAIPPAYSKFIGQAAMAQFSAELAA